MSEPQKLSIPCGWKVMWNQFLETDPDTLEKDSREWLLFSEDILYIKRIKTTIHKDDLALDLGWYPEADPDGEFCLYVIKNDNWAEPEEAFRSRSVSEISDKIEDLLRKYS